MDQIIQCVPNFSEGRDQEKIKAIVDMFRNRKNVKLLDYQSDRNHHRSVVTAVGSPDEIKAAVIDAVEKAVALIDLRSHKGEHPRMGAVDVIPFVPIKGIAVDDTVVYAKEVAGEIAERFDLPIFLYESAAAAPERKNLADVRSGQFESMAEKMKSPEWRPDYGPEAPHASAGVTAIGVRMPLIAFNVNLGTRDKSIADRIARKVRYISGGFRYVKGIGVELKDKEIVQVSMNLTNYKKTSITTVFSLVLAEAKRYGVPVVGSEIIGIVPMEALADTAAHFLRIDGFSMNQVLENRLLE